MMLEFLWNSGCDNTPGMRALDDFDGEVRELQSREFGIRVT